MAEIPLAALRAVAARLDDLGLDYAFLGGSVVGLLLDKPEFTPVRATDDVDVVIEMVSQARYADAVSRHAMTQLIQADAERERARGIDETRGRGSSTRLLVTAEAVAYRKRVSAAASAGIPQSGVSRCPLLGTTRMLSGRGDGVGWRHDTIRPTAARGTRGAIRRTC